MSNFIVSTQNGQKGEWRKLVAIAQVELVLEFNPGRLWCVCVWEVGGRDRKSIRKKLKKLIHDVFSYQWRRRACRKAERPSITSKIPMVRTENMKHTGN